MATREQIMEALFAVLKNSGKFITTSRRLTDPQGLAVAESPALFLVEHEDPFDRKSGFNQLPIRSLHARAMIYNDVGDDQNAIPSSFINAAIDALDGQDGSGGLFKPDNPQANAFTLGGMVQSCTIDGTIERASGDVTGKAMAIVPIRIVIP